MTATDPATVRREAMEEASRIADKRQTMLEAKGRRHPDNSPSREACAQAAYEAMWLASAIRGAATRPAEATGDVKLVETRQRLREIILGWSGLDESDLEPIVDAIMREVIVPVDRGYAILGRTYDGVDVLQPKTHPSAFLLGLVGKPELRTMPTSRQNPPRHRERAMIAVEPMSTNEEFLWVADCPVCKTHHAVRARVAPPRICLSCLRADFPNWEAVERRDTASPPADPAADRDGGGGT